LGFITLLKEEVSPKDVDKAVRKPPKVSPDRLANGSSVFSLLTATSASRRDVQVLR
jgi:hypothetical protein